MQAEEFFFFAAFLAVVATIFSIMAYFYKYVYYGSSRTEGENEPLIDTDEIQLEERKGDGGDDDDDEEMLNVAEPEETKEMK